MEEGEAMERKKKKRKNKEKTTSVGKEDFSVAGPTFMAVQQVTALRCNQRLICGLVFEFFSCT
jgi:hypothetical protein